MDLHLLPEQLGGRRAWLGRAARYDELVGPTPWPQPHFILFPAADITLVSNVTRRTVADHLLRAGAVYVCAWGPAANELEEDFDFAAVLTGDRNSADSVLMTTSHASEDLEEALWFAVHSTWPDAAYEQTCSDVVLLTVGHADWEQRARAYLTAGAPLPGE